MLRWASGIMIFLGLGHLSLVTLSAGEEIAGWAERGLWAAVPLTLGRGGDAATMSTKLTFWSGPGSFAVPLIVLGCLIWHLARRGVAVPAAVGWAVAAWCVVGGVLLVPSPFFAGAVAGVLIAMAARKSTQSDEPVTAA